MALTQDPEIKLPQGSDSHLGLILSPGRHLAVSGDSFCRHDWGAALLEFKR